jgi:hypothetical protein
MGGAGMGGAGMGGAGMGGAGMGGMGAECRLINDAGGPGQYADGCVKREWIAAYAGTYTSANCNLTIAIDGSVPATFTLRVTGAMLAGTYTNDWEGGTGPGNDSYYRFTTDTTFSTPKALHFTAGRLVNPGEEHSIRLQVNDVNTTPNYSAGFTKVLNGVNEEVDCGPVTKM